MDRNYAAFISYRHAELDSAVAAALHGFIEKFNIPRSLRADRGRSFGYVFRDMEELPASSDLSENICRALDRSEYLIVICSPAAAQSPWVSREIEYFLAHHERRKVLAVLIEGEPAVAFPSPLTELRNPDGSITTVEPLAVDARAEDAAATVRKLKREALRLYAAMLGCPYDTLVQRRQRRSRRRAAAAMALVLAVALGFSGMMLVKNHQIDLKNQELEAKNEELSAQKAEILLRESELLTQNAADALSEGSFAAVGYAADALPGDGSPDRPYYAPAERALISALNIFGERREDYLLETTTLNQLGAVSDFIISADGARLVSIDASGVLNCFDTASGGVLWSAAVPAGYSTTVYDHRWPLTYCESRGSVIAFFGGTLASFGLETGEVLWQQGPLTVEDDHIHLSPDESRLVCLVRELSPYTGLVSQKLCIYSTENGDKLSEIPITEPHTSVLYLSNTFPGAFSPDGESYAFSFMALQEDGSQVLQYFLADLESGSVECIRRESLDRYYYENTVEDLSFSDDGSALFAVRLSPEGGIGACIEKIDLAAGEMLWRSQPETAEGEIDRSSPLHVIHTPSNIYLVRGSSLHCIELGSGTELWSALFPGNVAHIETVQNQFFCYMLSDGRQGLAWRNESGLYTSELYGAEVGLGAVDRVQLWDSGFIRAEVEDFNISSISVAGDGSRGFAAVISPDDDSSINLVRSVSLAGLVQKRSTALEGSLFEPLSVICGGKLAVGPFNSYSDSGENHLFAFFDPETLSCDGTVPTESTDGSGVHILPDASGYITDDGFGGIILHRADGSQSVLSEGMTEALSEHFSARVYASATTRLADGSVLSLRCDGRELCFWRNGSPAETVPLPDGLIWATHDNVSYNRLLALGENGLVVLSCFSDEADALSDAFAVYDTANRSWRSLTEEGSGQSGRYCTVGSAAPIFAIMESDGSAAVYDAAAKSSAAHFELGLSLSSIEQLELIMGDSVLMAKTANGQLILFDAQSGEKLLQESLSGTSGSLASFEDTENSRLYVSHRSRDFGGSYGLCIDTRSWTTLAYIDGLLYHDSERNEIWRWRDGSLTVSALPSTSELVKLARGLES